MTINHLRPIPGKKATARGVEEASRVVVDAPAPTLGEAVRLLENLPFPSAFWNHNRRWCAFNKGSRDLLGFCEHDFASKSSLWLDQVHPDDRAMVAAEWATLQNGEAKMVCAYRFLPKHKNEELRLRENAFLYQP